MAEARSKMFRYGMRLRGYSIGCQPMKGLIRRETDISGKYLDILVYGRRLTDKELSDYELDDLNRRPKKRLTVIREQHGVKQSDMAEALHISVRTIQGWELNGMNKTPLESAVKVAHFFGISVEELLEP